MITLFWERLIDSDDFQSSAGLITERARVPGGWLVRSVARAGAAETGALALTFVPDECSEWQDD